MVSKVIDATEMRVGTYLLLDGAAHQVKKWTFLKQENTDTQKFDLKQHQFSQERKK